MANTDQKHPQEKNDRLIVDQLLRAKPEPFNLAELARLRIRYHHFPGARAIQRDLDYILQQWQLTEEDLFAKTRAIYASGQAYQIRNAEESEDWV